MAKASILIIISFFVFSAKAFTQLSFGKKADLLPIYTEGYRLPQNFYNQHLGFFCKKEGQLQKGLKVPLYIRLGSKQYVDYIENKPNAKSYALGNIIR